MNKPTDWEGTEKQWREFELEREIKLAGGSPNTKVHIDDKERVWFYFGGFMSSAVKWPPKEEESENSSL